MDAEEMREFLVGLLDDAAGTGTAPEDCEALLAEWDRLVAAEAGLVDVTNRVAEGEAE